MHVSNANVTWEVLHYAAADGGFADDNDGKWRRRGERYGTKEDAESGLRRIACIPAGADLEEFDIYRVVCSQAVEFHGVPEDFPGSGLDWKSIWQNPPEAE